MRPRKTNKRYITTAHKVIRKCKTKQGCYLREDVSIPITDVMEKIVLPVDVGGGTLKKYVLC